MPAQLGFLLVLRAGPRSGWQHSERTSVGLGAREGRSCAPRGDEVALLGSCAGTKEGAAKAGRGKLVSSSLCGVL